MAKYEFKLPDIGEGIAEAEIVAWHVKVGDTHRGRPADRGHDDRQGDCGDGISGRGQGLGCSRRCAGPGTRIVFASSSSVYGDSERYPTHEDALPLPVSPYGVTKLAPSSCDGLPRRPGSTPLRALLHRLRPTPAPRHGVLPVLRRGARRPDRAVRRRQPGARLHLRRRRRDRDPRGRGGRGRGRARLQRRRRRADQPQRGARAARLDRRAPARRAARGPRVGRRAAHGGRRATRARGARVRAHHGPRDGPARGVRVGRRARGAEPPLAAVSAPGRTVRSDRRRDDDPRRLIFGGRSGQRDLGGLRPSAVHRGSLTSGSSTGRVDPGSSTRGSSTRQLDLGHFDLGSSTLGARPRAGEAGRCRPGAAPARRRDVGGRATRGPLGAVPPPGERSGRRGGPGRDGDGAGPAWRPVAPGDPAGRPARRRGRRGPAGVARGRVDRAPGSAAARTVAGSGTTGSGEKTGALRAAESDRQRRRARRAGADRRRRAPSQDRKRCGAATANADHATVRRPR